MSNNGRLMVKYRIQPVSLTENPAEHHMATRYVQTESECPLAMRLPL
jgi:hypothetical protein